MGFPEPDPDERPVYTYEVSIKAFTTVVIEAHDEREAIDDAIFAADMGDCTLDEASAKLLHAEDVESAKRLTDRFVPLD